jgi:Holliday junction resolvase
MTEKQVQTSIIKILHTLGWYVIKTRPGSGTPTGMLDIVAFNGRTYIVLEIKKSKNAKWQPLQPETLAMFKRWGVYAKAVYPENLEEVKNELRRMSM